MARKSAALRLSQALDLITDYEAVSFGDHKNCRFARDMVVRLQRGRGLSPKQRNWLDNIIEEGVPEAKNADLVALLEAAGEVVGMEGKAHILKDFAYRARCGWSFTEKQQAFVDALLAEAEKLQLEGPFEPDVETVDSLRKCVKLAKSRSNFYWSSHPGEGKSLNATVAWLEWIDGDREGPRPHFDAWCAERFAKSLKSRLREFENPKFQIGEMRWLWVNGDYAPALVMDGPHISDYGKIVYSALVNGECVETHQLTKVRRRS